MKQSNTKHLYQDTEIRIGVQETDCEVPNSKCQASEPLLLVIFGADLFQSGVSAAAGCSLAEAQEDFVHTDLFPGHRYHFR